MKVLRDAAAVRALTETHLVPLIEQRLQDLAINYDVDPWEVVFFIVVETGDVASDLDLHLGRSVTEGIDMGDGVFYSLWELLEEHASCYEMAVGRPYTTIARAWYVIRKKAGLADNVRFHDLRHTFASRLVLRGRNPFEAQKLLGHADPRTTMRYAHLDMGVMQEASNVASLKVA